MLRGLSAEVVTVTREPGWKSRKATPLGKRGRKRWKHLYTPQKSNVDSKKWPYGLSFWAMGMLVLQDVLTETELSQVLESSPTTWWKKILHLLGGCF